MPTPPVDEIKAHLWDKRKIFQWRPFFGCEGVMRYHLSEPAARALLREFWPASRPHFWVPDAEKSTALDDRLKLMNGGRGPLVGEHYYRQYFKIYEYSGFATRVGGGMFWSGGFASTVFPFRADDGIPWITPALANAPIIYRDIELAGGSNAGYAYCYDALYVGPIRDAHLPDYYHRRFATRVDGELVDVKYQGPNYLSFYENDEYVYYEFHFDLT